MSELKSCPFCGCKDVDYNNDTGPSDEGFWEWYECNNCSARTDTEKEWNTRAPDPLAAQLAEALEKHRKWLLMVEGHSLKNAEINKGRFESLREAELADAKNYAAMGKHIDEALKAYNKAYKESVE